MTHATPSRRVPALVLGLSVAGFAATACGIPATEASTAGAHTGPIRCELILDETRGNTTIEGRVSTDRPVHGSYRLSITSSSSGGRAMINQSGDFTASPGSPAVLGQTTLGGTRAQYRADLEVSLPGERLTCNQRGGARDL
jgi:hypothetical protein